MIPAWIGDEMRRFERGLALHYAVLYSAVYGLEAQAVCEFGAGWSTRAILEALAHTGGQLISCSTEPIDQVILSARIDRMAKWSHHTQLSETLPETFRHDPTLDALRFDLVLHDGSHTAEVVEADLRFILPRVRQYGLVLIHDTQHSGAGQGMRQAVMAILRDFDLSSVTLPYGFGLTILRNEAPTAAFIRIDRRKRGSEHWTQPTRVGSDGR